MRRLFRLHLGERHVGRDVDDELRFHFEMAVRHYMSLGMRDDEARREAERRFGDVERTRVRLEAIDRGRDERQRRAEWWGGIAQDLRYTFRGLRARPAFTAVVVVTLALGIGANATMFGIVDRLLLRPPAYLRDPEHAQRVYLIRTFDNVEQPTSNIGYKRYLELTRNTSAFEETAAFFNTELAVGTGAETSEQMIGLVSASYWHFFGVRPTLGRFFGVDEDRVPEGAPVAVLGYGTWQSTYGGARDVLGKSIAIGRRTYTIIGVAPRGFTGMSQTVVAAFIPITLGVYDLFGGFERAEDRTRWYTTHNMSWMEMLARRKAGVSIETASADLTTAYRQSWLATPKAQPLDEYRPRAIAAPILAERGPRQGNDSKVATWLIGVSGIVLLIACANVANLLLARAFGRRREIALRVALGVSRGRLVLQLLAESLVLALLGAVGGLVISQWGGGVLRTALLPDYDWPNALGDSRMLIFAAAAALAVGLLTGLAPVFHAQRSDVSAALKAGAREGTYHRSRTRTALLVAQGALSVVLLVGAGLFVRSLRSVRGLDLGYDADHLAYVALEMRGTSLDSAHRVALGNELMRRAVALPGVESATLTATVPFYMSWDESIFDARRDSIPGNYPLNSVSPSYFATAGTRIVRGRGITDADVAGAPPVAVVSASMAKKIWPNADPIGQCIRVGADTVPCTTVVGVAQDIVSGDLLDDPRLFYYVAAAQKPPARGLFVRSRNDATTLVATLRRELQRAMPGASFVRVRSLREILDPNIRSWRLGATMFALFGVLALLLAAVGLYSVIAYNVSQRRHELGVRLALGAQTRDVLRLVLAAGVRVAAAGIVIGGIIALVAGRFVAPLLFRTSPRDPLVFTSVTVMLIAVAVLASLLPAMRASRVDPSVALRSE